MSWLVDIVEQHKELESPLSFYYWSALTAISAIVKDNVWFDKQIYNLYPNIYVMLYADSGLKKGPAINFAKKLVSAVNNTRIISGRSSIQGIMKEIGQAYTAPGGEVIKGSNAFICSSELSASLVEDKAALDILTDLYDRHYNEGDYKSLLKMESFKLKDATITLLGGINEAHAENLFQKKDIQGGYIARSFVIHETKRGAINSLMFPLENPPNYVSSIEYLKEVAKLKGPFEMDVGTRRYFDNWYHEFKNYLDSREESDPTGTLNRFDDSVLKVAMLISLGTEPTLRISEAVIKDAIGRCEKLVGNVRKTTSGSGKSTQAGDYALLMKELALRDNHTITRQQWNKKHWERASSQEWDLIAESMASSGRILIETQGNQICYRMPDAIAEKVKKHFEGKS